MSHSKQFNLAKLISQFNLNQEEVAKVLFPYIKYQTLALNRILSGEAVLDVIQLENLAAFIGINMHELFNYDSWASISENGQLIFVNGNYKVICHTSTGVISLFYNGNVVDTYIMSPGLTTISEFINSINKQILEHEACIESKG